MRTYRSAKLSTGPHATGSQRPVRLLLLLSMLALVCGAVRAQETGTSQPQQAREDGPPPLRYLPEDVRRRLEAENDLKARARLGILVAEERLARASQLANEDRFEAATGEIGIYQAVVDDTIRFLHASGRVNNKLRDNFKRVEIALRAHVTQLESIRRSLPSHHAVYLKDAIEFVRDQRDKALAAFYDDTVIREPVRPAMTTAAGERATTSATARPEVEKKPQRER